MVLSDHEILPSGYNIYRRDRLNRVSGGSLIAIKSSLCSREVDLPIESTGLEVVMVEIENLKKDRKLLVVNCYRPPNDREFIVKFEHLLKSLKFTNCYSIIILGDFNYPNIEWVEGSGFQNSTPGEEQTFSNLLMNFFLFQLVENSTRANNILDLVFTNTPNFIVNVDTGPPPSELVYLRIIFP